MKLYRFAHSPYARYVQAAIELADVPCEVIDVRYGDREELARLTGGYIMVPVLERDDGSVLGDSHSIMAVLVRADARFAALVPEADAGPIWAYADWAGSLLEDVAFRLASPALVPRFASAFERSLFVFVKERKFGSGCIEQWSEQADALFAQLCDLLEPTLRTLAARPFLFGKQPTLADCALYGQLAMLDLGAADRVAEIAEPLHAWRQRFEARLGAPPYGPVADVHHGRDALDARLAAASDKARSGALELIVVRTATHERATPDRVELVVDGGVAGDRWAQSGANPGHDVSLMDVRAAGAMAERAHWPLFGDNLFVDFDLSTASLQPGDRLRLGDAVLEITAEPHLGCRKLSARFGREALRWVNHKSVRDQRRRGIFAKVVQAATVAVGDTLVRL
ncbi:MAG: glutathione S-transferase N-terminal domain-containing protein [Myxococcales bacterium]|nr:glutathione S-transferase N-terminal domain-containing protein [Myxococcales bacterium]